MDPVRTFPKPIAQQTFSYFPIQMQSTLCRVSKLWKIFAEDDPLWNQTYGCTKEEFKLRKPIYDTFTPELIDAFGGIKRFLDYPKIDITNKLTWNNKHHFNHSYVPDNFISLDDMIAPIMWCQLPLVDINIAVRGIIAMRLRNAQTNENPHVELFYTTRFKTVRTTIYLLNRTHKIATPDLLEKIKQAINTKTPINI